MTAVSFGNLPEHGWSSSIGTVITMVIRPHAVSSAVQDGASEQAESKAQDHVQVEVPNTPNVGILEAIDVKRHAGNDIDQWYPTQDPTGITHGKRIIRSPISCRIPRHVPPEEQGAPLAQKAFAEGGRATWGSIPNRDDKVRERAVFNLLQERAHPSRLVETVDQNPNPKRTLCLCILGLLIHHPLS